MDMIFDFIDCINESKRLTFLIIIMGQKGAEKTLDGGTYMSWGAWHSTLLEPPPYIVIHITHYVRSLKYCINPKL